MHLSTYKVPVFQTAGNWVYSNSTRLCVCPLFTHLDAQIPDFSVSYRTLGAGLAIRMPMFFIAQPYQSVARTSTHLVFFYFPPIAQMYY
jgi:hypothetical protein